MINCLDVLADSLIHTYGVNNRVGNSIHIIIRSPNGDPTIHIVKIGCILS